MSDIMSASIQKLKSSSLRLNKASDTLGRAVQDIENLFGNELNVGIKAFVEVQSITHGDVESVTQYLGYCRVGQRFRIVVSWVSDMFPEDENVKPWSDCARAVKVETAKKLPDLIAMVADSIDEQIAEAEETADVTSSIVASLTLKEAE